MMKKIVLILFICIFLITNVIMINSQNVNWAKALQLSLYFYDANMCGAPVGGNKLEWRGDCHLRDLKAPLTPERTNLSQAFINANKAFIDPDGDGFIDISGGFHDAGDHVKFGLPQSYTASTLAWGYYEFKDAFVLTGENDHILNILKWFTDYFLKCTYKDAAGNVAAFCYMVGEGTVDHTYWGPPELQKEGELGRQLDFATSETPASDQAAGAAAALALMYLIYQDIDLAYATECLDTAKALYTFAVANRGLGVGDGFYTSSYDEDELAWAAVWLNIATNDPQYITDITSTDASGNYTGYIKKIIKDTGNHWNNIWTHSWDTVWSGVFTKLAHLTTNPEWDFTARWNFEYWSGGLIQHGPGEPDGYLIPTPAGYAMLNNWGSARYNTASQLCILVYHKYKDRMDMVNWAKGQMEYIMGNNPMNRCYEVGYDATSAVHPHHRAAHGSKTNSMLNPVEDRHKLWGALVGGPDQTDKHVDDRTDYIYNEVAIDYNAGFVGALAGHYLLFGAGTSPEPNFPPLEPAFDAYFAEAKLEQENTERTQVTINIHNESAVPPQFNDKMSVRYFINIEELLAAGQTIADVRIEIYYDEQKSDHGQEVAVTGPFRWGTTNHIYYYELDWSGYEIYGDREIQIALIAEQGPGWKSYWDPTNDFSRQNIVSVYSVTENIPFYIDGVKVFGNEPDPNSSSSSTASSSSSSVSSSSSSSSSSSTTSSSSSLSSSISSSSVSSSSSSSSSVSTGLTATYVIADQWGDGFVANVTVSNPGTTASTNWTLSWTYSGDQTIGNSWNSDLTQTGKNVTAKSFPWNGAIPPNGSITFGFQGSFSGTNDVPIITVE